MGAPPEMAQASRMLAFPGNYVTSKSIRWIGGLLDYDLTTPHLLP